MLLLDLDELLAHIRACRDHYEKGGWLTMSGWLDGLYMRITDNPDGVCLSEIITVLVLKVGDTYVEPYVANNTIDDLVTRLRKG